MRVLISQHRNTKECEKNLVQDDSHQEEEKRTLALHYLVVMMMASEDSILTNTAGSCSQADEIHHRGMTG